MTTITNIEDPGAPGNNCAGSLAIHRAGFFSPAIHSSRPRQRPKHPPNAPELPLFLIFSHFFASFRAFRTLFAPKPVVITPFRVSYLLLRTPTQQLLPTCLYCPAYSQNNLKYAKQTQFAKTQNVRNLIWTQRL